MFVWACYDRMAELDIFLGRPFECPPRHHWTDDSSRQLEHLMEQAGFKPEDEKPVPPEDQRLYRIERDPQTRKIVSYIVDGYGNPVFQ